MTTDWLAMQRLARAEFDRRLQQVTDWHASTPDTEWDVADLVKHVVDEQRWIAPLLSGLSFREARGRLSPIGVDLRAEWALHSAAATEAWAAADPDAPVDLDRDSSTVHEYLVEETSDVIIHTWDLARGVGADETLPDALVEAAWSYFEPISETLQGSGLFSGPVHLPADAPLQWRLLALTGRDPR